MLAPFLWVAVELLRAHVVSFPWLLLGTAQIDNLPLTRLASVTGVYGMSFEIALVNTVFAAAMLVHRKRRKTLLVAALAGAIALQATVLVRWSPARWRRTPRWCSRMFPSSGNGPTTNTRSCSMS